MYISSCKTFTETLDWNKFSVLVLQFQKGIIFCKIEILKKHKFAQCVIIQAYLTDSTTRYYFIHFGSWSKCQKWEEKSHGNINILLCTYINYKLKMLKKRYQEEWENAYLTLKNARASRALRWALDPNWCMLMLLTLQHSTQSANLWKIC